MKEMLLKIKSRFSMKKIGELFVDIVNDKKVYLYTDQFGVEWMAQSKFGFRTKTKEK